MSHCPIFKPLKSYHCHTSFMSSIHSAEVMQVNLPVLNSHLSQENFLLLRDGSFFRPGLELLVEEMFVGVWLNDVCVWTLTKWTAFTCSFSRMSFWVQKLQRVHLKGMNTSCLTEIGWGWWPWGGWGVRVLSCCEILTSEWGSSEFMTTLLWLL